MKWIDNMVSVFEHNKDTACPCCGSQNTNHSFTVVNEKSRMGYADIWCEDCRRGIHLSRLIVPQEGREENAPTDIKYE